MFSQQDDPNIVPDLDSAGSVLKSDDFNEDVHFSRIFGSLFTQEFICPVATKEEYIENLIRIYNNFNQENKKSFLIALFTKNCFLLQKTTQQYGLKEDFFLATNKLFLITHTQKLHPWILEGLKRAFTKENLYSLVILLQSTFQSIPETSLNKKDTGIMGMKLKRELISNLLLYFSIQEKTFLLRMIEVSYDESLPTFRPAVESSSFVKTKITLAEYKVITKKGVDISEFIILTLGLLETCKDKLPTFLLADLASDYLLVKYNDCLNKIEAYCFGRLGAYVQWSHPLFQLSTTDKQIFCEVLKCLKKVLAFCPEKNHPRRFFETRLSQYIVGLTHDEKTVGMHYKSRITPRVTLDDSVLRDKTLYATNKILTHVLGENGRVDNPCDMEVKISLFANIYKDEKKYSPEYVKEARILCKSHDLVDRLSRPEEDKISERRYEKMDPDKYVLDSIWNSSGGAMTSLSPTFLDAQIYPPMRNMIADAGRKAPYDKEKKQWSSQNNRQYAAYVGSISGHICDTLSVLQEYMETHHADPDLNQDLNLFLIQVIAIYVKRGFHSFLEVMDIFHDESVQEKIFNKFGVVFNPEYYFKYEKTFENFLKYSMNDALAYTKVLCLKRGVLNDIVNNANENINRI